MMLASLGPMARQMEETVAKSDLRQEIAAVLRVSMKNLDARIMAMKLGPICSRCGGCGRYSFNQIDGDRCFGCNGHGVMKPRQSDLPGVLEAAKAAAADGRLDRYVDGLRAAQVAKHGRDRFFAAWRASKVARVLEGWGSHMYGHGDDPIWQVPGNFAEIREANRKMAKASEEMRAAVDAWQNARPAPGVDRQELAIAAEIAVEKAIAEVAAADIDPSPELIAFVREKQRQSAEKVKSRGFEPGFEIYQG